MVVEVMEEITEEAMEEATEGVMEVIMVNLGNMEIRANMLSQTIKVAKQAKIVM